MPWLLSLVATLASSVFVRGFLTQLLIALGVSIATYTGTSVIFDHVWDSVNSHMGSMAQSAASFLSMCGVFRALNVIASGYASALAIKGLAAGGVLKRLKWGASGSVVAP